MASLTHVLERMQKKEKPLWQWMKPIQHYQTK